MSWFMRRAAGILATTTVVAVSLTACGNSSDERASGTTNDPTPLTKDQVSAALLTSKDLGPGYQQVPDDDEDAGLGCLAFMDDLGEADGAAASVQAQLSRGKDDFQSPGVDSLVESFEDTGKVSDLFDSIRGDLDGCDSIQQKVDNLAFDLDLTTDAEKATSDVDDQVNITATGSVGSKGMRFPISLRVSLVRIDNHLTGVAVSGLGEDPGLIGPLTEVATDRLAAIAAGQDPPPAEAVTPERS